MYTCTECAQITKKCTVHAVEMLHQIFGFNSTYNHIIQVWNMKF